MSLTNRQQGILEQMSEVEVRSKRTGQWGYRLHGDDVTTTITSLIVKELVVKTSEGRRITLTEKGRGALGGFGT